MGHVKIQRGIEVDVPFELRKSKGGALIDDADWTDGTTAAQWPTATWKNSSSEADVTSDVVKDITSDTIASATHKHPDPTTGIWRSAQGKYWIRINPANSLNLTDYDLDVAFDVSSTEQYDETHVYELVLPGDVDFGDAIATSITVSDVEAGISTALSDAAISSLITEGAEWVESEIESCGNDPDTVVADGVPKKIRQLVLKYVRLLIFRFDVSAGLKPMEVQEGFDRIKFPGRGAMDTNRMMEEIEREIKKWCDRQNASSAFDYYVEGVEEKSDSR